MSEIECTQLHNELLGCRHSTLQSHGLFALAKHLLVCCAVMKLVLFCYFAKTVVFGNKNVIYRYIKLTVLLEK